MWHDTNSQQTKNLLGLKDSLYLSASTPTMLPKIHDTDHHITLIPRGSPEEKFFERLSKEGAIG
jgi:DNA primase